MGLLTLYHLCLRIRADGEGRMSSPPDANAQEPVSHDCTANVCTQPCGNPATKGSATADIIGRHPKCFADKVR